MPELIGLDFETYGAEDLPTHGLARYTDHKTFMPLIGSVSLPAVMPRTFDFVSDRRASVRDLADAIGPRYICAHNAPFEERVLSHLGLDYPSSRFIDSAVVARAAGAGSSLEAAAPQLLGVDKMEMGKALIKLFSIPGKYQEESGSKVFDPQIIADHPAEWAKFREYCELDAELSLRIVEAYQGWLAPREQEFQAITMDMNRAGWCVDVELVEEMQRRYLENQDQALADFRDQCGAGDLNLNSLPQLKKWCEERGVKASSFDEKHVERLLARIEKKLETLPVEDPKYSGYRDVQSLLETKQILGGSSLKKLQVILNTTLDMGDGTHRLKDQYLHCGAAQTLRTTGRSVQMQNLKRLGNRKLEDIEAEVFNLANEVSNNVLAENLRQVFTASELGGRLIVGDFSSVESRGLAWQAGEDWKLAAYRQGLGVYEMQAAKIFGVPYQDITKTDPRRTTGKVGELSCGYGAGSVAVRDFAAGMNVELTEGEATQLVYDWRTANPNTVNYWSVLDAMLHQVVEGHTGIERLAWPDGYQLKMALMGAPASLQRQHPKVQTLMVWVVDQLGDTLLKRFFHGAHIRGRNVCYFKPSDRKTGDLWRNSYVDPKTKQRRFYELYGGKLAGILTQSLCRELFFMVLRNAHSWAKVHRNVELVGQFHDEIVVDWRPPSKPASPGIDLPVAKHQLEKIMSDPGPFQSFPLAAEIKDDYRYTK